MIIDGQEVFNIAKPFILFLLFGNQLWQLRLNNVASHPCTVGILLSASLILSFKNFTPAGFCELNRILVDAYSWQCILAQNVPTERNSFAKFFYLQDVPTEHASQTLRPVRDVLWVGRKTKFVDVP
jgi:hypothetical protein